MKIFLFFVTGLGLFTFKHVKKRKANHLKIPIKIQRGAWSLNISHVYGCPYDMAES